MNKRLMLMKRSQLLMQLRAFFYAREVIEVDAPMLSKGGTPDVHLASLSTQVQVPGEPNSQTFYLPTSPEYPMKRLLCAGSGDIFYLGKVFRNGDLSPRHQIEFMMLEWYRIGFSMFDLMDEVVGLLTDILAKANAKRNIETMRVEKLSYQQAFLKYAGIVDVNIATTKTYQTCLTEYNIPKVVGVDDRDISLWEQLVLTEIIEPQLGKFDNQLAITVLYHYPAKQSSLAQVSKENLLVAERFEVFVNGMELANGYHELIEAEVYKQRFTESLAKRKANGLPMVSLDEYLLETLAEQGLPDCSGVALGVDRLFALQQAYQDISQGIGFGILES